MSATASPPLPRDAELLRSLVHRIDRSDAGAFNNLGVLYHSKGLHPEAVDAFLRALVIDPRMRTAARNLEVAAAVAGACDRQLSMLAERIARSTEDIDARREEARLLRLIGRLDEAERKLDALIAETPDDVDALLERGLLEQRTGDLRRAQRWLERARNASPEDVVVRLHLAEVFYNRGANEQALVELDELLRHDDGVPEAHLLRGFVLGDIGRVAEAAEAASRAAALKPALAQLHSDLALSHDEPPEPAAINQRGELAYYGLALAFRQRGYFDEARRELLRARERGEDDRLVSHAIAELDLIAGESERARLAYESLLAMYGDSARWWCEHGVALHQLGELDAAVGSYQRAIQLDRRYTLAQNNLAVARAQLGDRTASHETLQRAAAMEPMLVKARLNLALWYEEHGQSDQALTLLRALETARPADGDVFLALGAVLHGRQDYTDARQALAHAVELQPQRAAVRYLLSETLAALGDHEGAVREAEQAMRISPVRPVRTLQLGIELQVECPDATSGIDLLSMRAENPLSGTQVSAGQMEWLLTENTQHVAVGSSAPAAQATVDSARAELARADDFALRGLHGEAMERYERAWRILAAERNAGNLSGYCESTFVRARIGDARCRCFLHRGPEVIDALRILDREYDGNAEILALLAVAEGQEGSSEGASRARDVMHRLLRLQPDSAGLLHFVGEAALEFGLYEMAIRFCRRALILDPDRPSPRVTIARVLRDQGNAMAAQLELSAAIAVAPTLRAARFDLARLHVDGARAQAAIQLLAALLLEDPTDIESLLLLARALLSDDRQHDARIALARARRHAPDDMRIGQLDAEILQLQGREREAAEQRRRLSLQFPPEAANAA